MIEIDDNHCVRLRQEDRLHEPTSNVDFLPALFSLSVSKLMERMSFEFINHLGLFLLGLDLEKNCLHIRVGSTSIVSDTQHFSYIPLLL